MDEIAQDAHPKTKRRFHFSTWRLDFYSFAVDLTIEPGMWVVFIVRTGKRVFKWEHTIDYAK